MYQWIDYEGKLILNEMHGKNENHTLPQVIQRVTIPVHDDETGIEVTIAFDDTPGYVDTTYDHQIDNVSLSLSLLCKNTSEFSFWSLNQAFIHELSATPLFQM